MDIAIIGAGTVGRSLATAFTRAGHAVVISSRDPEDAGTAAAQAGARVAASNAEAAATADVVVLAIPFSSAEDVVREIADAVKGTPVVDVSNRMSHGPQGPSIDASTSNAEMLQGWLPGSPVVKAFNTLFASNQADPIRDGTQLDGFVAADDPTAKARVVELVASIGLKPIDVGPLARAQQLEQLAFLNIVLNLAEGSTWTSGWKLVGAPASLPVAA